MPARITNAANKTRAEEGTTTMNANKTRTTAANTIKETVVSTARKTTRKAATAATPTTKAQQERLAAGAKRAADKAVAEAEREALSINTDDARTQARADKASAKAEAAKQRANELAEDAGLKLPFPAPRKRAARKPVATKPAPRTAAAKAADARGGAQSARSRKVEADKRAAKGRTGQFAPKPVDKRRKPTLTKFGSMLLAVIGSGQTSFFDDGIVKDSGIWHECLTGETAGSEGLPKTAAGVANVIDRLVEQGMLGKGEQGEDGVWVWLTEAGAREARNLAKSIFSVRNNDGKKVTGEPEVKPAKKAAAAKPVGAEAPKVQALREFAVEHGWRVSINPTDGVVAVMLSKDDEPNYVVTFTNAGSMDASHMPYMLRSDGSKVLLRNVSAVKANLMTEAEATAAGKASLRVKREVVRGARVRAVRGAADDQPRKRIPFNIELAEDDEVLDALAGRTITWRRTLDNGTLTATIGRKVWMGKANKPGKERVVHFIERVKGKRVNEGGQRSLRLDMLVSVD